jgi:hypothetical protein
MWILRKLQFGTKSPCGWNAKFSFNHNGKGRA